MHFNVYCSNFFFFSKCLNDINVYLLVGVYSLNVPSLRYSHDLLSWVPRYFFTSDFANLQDDPEYYSNYFLNYFDCHVCSCRNLFIFVYLFTFFFYIFLIFLNETLNLRPHCIIPTFNFCFIVVSINRDKYNFNIM